MTTPAAKKARSEGKPDDFYTNCIRCLAVDTVQKANSGHPGAPLGMAPIANLLWSEYLKYDPKDPNWHDRDRFVLSNGHASALIYSMLHLGGYKLSLDDLKQFRQWGSITPGHPERGVTDGVEVTTGPLGQGLSNAVGMAMAEAHLAAKFNQPGHSIVDHWTYVCCGDGCLMEGVGQEALSLAGHLQLEKLIVIYDDNLITIDGSTDVAFTEDHVAKYRALGFHTIVVQDGNADYNAMRMALDEARHVRSKPKMILLRTTIGFGAKLENTAKVHGSPLGAEDVQNLKKKFGRDAGKQFHVEPEVYEHFAKQWRKGQEANAAWKKRLEVYAKQWGSEAKEYKVAFDGTLPAAFKDALPRNGDKIATRKASENALASLLSAFPSLVGGSADLTSSNLTRPGSANLVDFQKGSYEGRYFRFGVREHAMAGVCNGMHAHGGLIPYCATFLNFIGYAQGSVRLAAMSHHGVIYVATHDGIGVGEDGPTHQPIELVAMLRATPNMRVYRPCDQNETSAAWACAIETRATPSVLCLSRQGTAVLAGSSFDLAYSHGAYAIVKCASPKVVLLSTGSEVGLTCKAAELLQAAGVAARVVSMPCLELFEQQSTEYKRSLIPEGVPVLSVEAYCSTGWEKFSHYHVGLNRWGASAPADTLYEKFGLTAANVSDKAQKLVKHYSGKPVPAVAVPLVL